MPEFFYAHIVPDANNPSAREKWTTQTVQEHCRNTAKYAAADLDSIGLSFAAYLAGLLHDVGKFCAAFQIYLEKAVLGEPAARGSVNHTFAGVHFILTRYHDPEQWGAYAPLTAELIAFAIGSHHGFFDCIDVKHNSGFQHRLDKTGIHYDESIYNFLTQCAGIEELDPYFRQAVSEIEAIVAKLIPLLSSGSAQADMEFYVGQIARLLTSAVIDGDRLDTAQFQLQRTFPKQSKRDRAALWDELSRQVDQLLNDLPAETAVAQARRTISQQCRHFAEQPSGIYRLNVPTGSGKTLSSLRYSLAHAAKYNKSRILFVSPLLSILSQNSKEIRKYIRRDDLILEHHTNVVTPSENSDVLDQMELLTETWDAPIIITTLVQLLNTMFSGRPSAVRRFQALCNSVIVIDEVQTVPSHLLSIFHLSLGFLSTVCNATVILCSATQPYDQAMAHPIPVPTKDMVPYDSELWQVFRRTALQNAGSYTTEEIPGLVKQLSHDVSSVLVVCNKKDEASSIYRDLSSDRVPCFHLSAAMCPAHREDVLEQLNLALEHPVENRTVVCISTQIMEAGVDISFQSVVRLTAGMENIIQAAGRCNRNGEQDGIAPVHIVQCKDENLRYLSDIQRAKDATLHLLAEFQLHPEQFDSDLSSDAAIRCYYQQLYRDMKDLPDGPVFLDGKKTSLYALLSNNTDLIDPAFDTAYESFGLRQAFKTAGRAFTVFDQNTTDVLVPYKDGAALILKLNQLRMPYDFEKMRSIVKQAKAYSVSLYQWQIQKLEQAHALVSLCDGSVLVLQEGYYHDDLGIQTDPVKLDFLEV